MIGVVELRLDTLHRPHRAGISGLSQLFAPLLEHRAERSDLGAYELDVLEERARFRVLAHVGVHLGRWGRCRVVELEYELDQEVARLFLVAARLATDLDPFALLFGCVVFVEYVAALSEPLVDFG